MVFQPADPPLAGCFYFERNCNSEIPGDQQILNQFLKLAHITSAGMPWIKSPIFSLSDVEH